MITLGWPLAARRVRPNTRFTSRSALLLGIALLTGSCTSGPSDRSGFYNLFLTAIVRDFANGRSFVCEIGFELDVQVPLPDSFTTAADAQVRRAVVGNAVGTVAEDTIVRGVFIRLERLRRDEPTPLGQDSVQITLTGGLTNTLHGLGTGGAGGWYDGAWSCASTVPPDPTEALRNAGYPDTELQPGEWHLFPYYPGD